MDVPPFLRSRPVPVRARHDGWTPVVQPRFILLLARGAGTDEAARRVGKRRQTAYALRKKAGAEAFAAAWDEALEFARLTREAAAAPADAMRPRNHAHAALLSWSSGRLRPAGGSWSRAACPGPARSGLGADGSAEPAPAADARKLTKLTGIGLERSEERRVGKEGIITCTSRGSPYH